MHRAAKLQFERTAREFALWRAVPEDERSQGPAWWRPAFEVAGQQEELPPKDIRLLERRLTPICRRRRNLHGSPAAIDWQNGALDETGAIGR